MSEHDRLFNRIAVYNGGCVRVGRISERGSATVTPLSPDSAVELREVTAPFQTDVGNLELYPMRSFDKVFPGAVILPGSTFSTEEIPSGSILDLSHGLPSGLSEESPWVVTTSSSIRGAVPKNIDLLNIFPTTRVTSQVHINLSHANDVVEFEDICFASTQTYAVLCTSGKSITFRRCRFCVGENGVVVAPDTNRPKCRARVTFESCRFENFEYKAIEVRAAGQVLLLNCKMQHCDVGVDLVNGAATLRCCTLLHMKSAGINAFNTKSEVHLSHCAILDTNDAAVFVQNGVKLSLLSCKITNATRAVCITGKKRCIVKIEQCSMYECVKGVTISYGKVDVTISETTFARQSNGLFVAWDVMGNIDIVNCAFDKTHGLHGVSSWCYKKCLVTIDGVEAPHKPLNEILSKVRNQYEEERPPLCQQRTFKKTGLVDVPCLRCKRAEPKNVIFKICARCKQVCYCSKECQVSLL